jgi:hypothetical protein
MAKKGTTATAKKPKTPKLKTQVGDQATLEANATFDDGARQEVTVRRVVCYNRACADYGRERNYDEACSCKRTSVGSKAEF